MRETPLWLDKESKIVEPEFCKSFLRLYPMKCIYEHFYTVDGIVPNEALIKRIIYEKILPYVNVGVAQTVERLFKLLQVDAYSNPLPLQTDRIHVANGTYFLNGEFTPEKEFATNRLAVSFNPSAAVPERWNLFLSELLNEEDIPTLQEYLGYCLLPTTKGQKMLMMIGKGGEGKSRIGLVMNTIFGTSMNTTSIQKVETSRFARADLENKLLMVDDDMDMSALPKTNYIKSIVTSECKMDMERKGVQSYQAQLYVRFLCFGNGALISLHDRSDGFFRRQIVLTTKDRPPNRTNDPFLLEKLVAEREGIFLWMLEGLQRLIANNYQFTISNRAKANIDSIVRYANNVVDFMASVGYVAYKADYTAPTKHLYEAYKIWCSDNTEKPLSEKSFSNHLSQNAEQYNLAYSDHIMLPGGKRCRGYEGVEVLIRYSEL